MLRVAASLAFLLFASACASLRDPQAVLRYESFGERAKDAELFDLARNLKSPEDRASHLALLKDLGNRHPDNVLVHRAYQDQMVAAGEGKECLREYTERKLVNPSAANHYFLARLMTTPEASEPLLRQAIAKDPAFYWAYTALGVVQHEIGDRDRAEQSLLRAVEICPEFAEGWSELAVFFESADPERTKDAWKRYTTIRPLEIRGRMNLGVAFLAIDRPKEARGQFELILRKDSKHKDALFALAKAELMLENPQAALAHYESILTIDSKEPLAHYNLGILYEQELQDLPMALREYEAFLLTSASREGEFFLRRVQAAKWVEELRTRLGFPSQPLATNP